MTQTVDSWLVSLGLDPQAFDAGLARALNETKAFAQQFERAGAQIDPRAFEKGLNQGVTEGLRDLEAELGTAAAGASAFEKQLLRSETAGASFSRGLSQVRGSTLALATSMLDVPGPLGRLTSGLLLLGAGSAIVTGLAAGVALIGFAYHELTEDSRKAAEALDKQTDALLRQQEAQRPLATAQSGFATQAADLAKLTEQFTLAARAAERAQALPGSSGVFAGAVALGQMAALTDQIVARERAMAQATANVGDAGVAAFAAIIAAGQGTPAVFEKAQAAVLDLEADLKKATAAGDFDQMANDVRGLGTLFGAFTSDASKKLDDLLARLRAGPGDFAATAGRALGLLDTNLEVVIGRWRQLAAAVEAQGGAGTASLETLRLEEQALGALIGEAERLTRITAERSDPLGDQITLLEKQGAVARQLADIFFKPLQTAKLPAVPDAADEIAQIQRVTDALEAAQGQLRADARLGLDTTEDQRQVEALTATFDEAVTAELQLLSGKNDASVLAVLKALEDAGHAVGIELGLGAKQAASLRDTMRTFRALADGVRQVADAFGGLSDSAAQALQGIESVAEGIASLPKDPIGGVAGIIGGAVGVLSSIFGGNSAHDQAVAQNTQALREAAAAFRAGVGNPALLKEAGNAADVLSTKLVKAIDAFHFHQTDRTIETLNRKLAEFGLTFDQLNEIAKANGIQLLDSEGHIVAEAFGALSDRLHVTIGDLTTFGQTVSEQRRTLTLQQSLFGTGQDPLGIDKQLLQSSLGDQFASALDGIDVNTGAGREAYRKFLQDLFTKIDSGFFTLHPEQLKISVDELTQIMQSSADSLNQLGDAANAATNSMLNVPTGFKLALARFDATLDQHADAVLKAGFSGGPGFAPTGNPSDGASLPLDFRTVGPSVQIILEAGALAVHAAPGESAEDLATRLGPAFVEELRRRAIAQTGDSLNFTLA